MRRRELGMSRDRRRRYLGIAHNGAVSTGGQSDIVEAASVGVDDVKFEACLVNRRW